METENAQPTPQCCRSPGGRGAARRASAASRSRPRGGRSPRRPRRRSALPSNQPSRISVEQRLARACAATAPARSRRSTCARRGRSRRRRTAPPGSRAPCWPRSRRPVPVQQQTMPCSARPSATSRAAASLAQAQSSRSSSLSAPCTIGSWPRRSSSRTTASATPVRSSAATEIRIALSLVLRRARVARGRDHRTPPVGRRRGRARGVGARAGHRRAEDVRPAARGAGRTRAGRRAPDRQDARGRGRAT